QREQPDPDEHDHGAREPAARHFFGEDAARAQGCDHDRRRADSQYRRRGAAAQGKGAEGVRAGVRDGPDSDADAELASNRPRTDEASAYGHTDGAALPHTAANGDANATASRSVAAAAACTSRARASRRFHAACSTAEPSARASAAAGMRLSASGGARLVGATT